MRFQKETEKEQSGKLDESQERIMSQKLRQENFRKNVVNTVKLYRLKRQLMTDKGSVSHKTMCDVSKQRFNGVHFKCTTTHVKQLSCEGKGIGGLKQ